MFEDITLWTLGGVLFIGIAVIIVLMIRKNLIEDEIKEKELQKFRDAIRENYTATEEAGGLCTRCTHRGRGRKATLRIYRNKHVNSLLVLVCPACGSLFQVNLESPNLAVLPSAPSLQSASPELKPYSPPRPVS